MTDEARSGAAVPDNWEAWGRKYGTSTVTGKMLMDVCNIIIETAKASGARMAKLEAEIAALKATPHLKYLGVWEDGVTYTPGNAVTRSGSLWVCKSTPIDAPGVDFHNWQLAVKKGSA